MNSNGAVKQNTVSNLHSTLNQALAVWPCSSCGIMGLDQQMRNSNR